MSEALKPVFDDADWEARYAATLSDNLDDLLAQLLAVRMAAARESGAVAKAQDMLRNLQLGLRSVERREELILQKLNTEPMRAGVETFIDECRRPGTKGATHPATGLIVKRHAIPLRIKLFDADKALAWAADKGNGYTRVKTEPVCAAFDAWFRNNGDVPDGFEATGGTERIEVK